MNLGRCYWLSFPCLLLTCVHQHPQSRVLLGAKWPGSRASSGLSCWGGLASWPKGSRAWLSVSWGPSPACWPRLRLCVQGRQEQGKKTATYFLFSSPWQLWLTVQPKNKPPLELLPPLPFAFVQNWMKKLREHIDYLSLWTSECQGTENPLGKEIFFFSGYWACLYCSTY